ncbi:MAG TPA: hypothetical protein VGE02_05050 [Gemmatimonadales bacterium]
MASSWLRSAFAVPAILAIAGCSGDLLSPAAAPASVSMAAAGGSARLSSIPANFTRADRRYASTGHAPSTGRSGSASLQSRALLGKDGTTLVEVTTGALDAAGAPGQLVKLQLKNLTDSTTRNYNRLSAGGSWSESLTRTTRGQLLQLQGNVRGIDRNRTDVVTVVDTVWLRPDLVASDLQHPARVLQGQFAELSVRVAEQNGDVGAAGDCVLTVDGTDAATTAGIWVDRGDAVDCVFHVRFDAVGTRQLQASVRGVVPGDWDVTNNSVSSTLEVVSPETILAGSASFAASDFTYQYHRTDSYWGCGWYSYYCNYDESGMQHTRDLRVNGSTPNAGMFTGSLLDVALTWTTAGTAYSASATASPSWYANNCGYGFDAATNTNVGYCRSPGSGHLTLSVRQYSGHVQYYAMYDGWSYSSYNHTYGLDAYPVGSDIAFDVRATDEGGNLYRMSGATAVTTSSADYSYSYCDWYYYGDCYSYTRTGTQSSGWTSF